MWTTVVDRNSGVWQFSPDGLEHLARQHVRQECMVRRSRTVREWHWIGPDVVNVETDFTSVRTDVERGWRPLFGILERRIAEDPQGALDDLNRLREEVGAWTQMYLDMQRSASHETMDNIDRSVARGEMGKTVATGVRDLSATMVVAGSAFMSGGTSLAFLGMGSVAKGAYRYQDTQNLGSALLTATGTFVVGAIPLNPYGGEALRGSSSWLAKVGGKEAIRWGEKTTLVIVGSGLDASLEGAAALAEGKNVRHAFGSAAMRFGLDIAAGGLGTTFDKWAIPFAARVTMDSSATFLSDRAVSAAGEEHEGHLQHRGQLSGVPTTSTNVALCDVNSTVAVAGCSASDWVRQVVLRRV
jgi:hypothetical protein